MTTKCSRTLTSLTILLSAALAAAACGSSSSSTASDEHTFGAQYKFAGSDVPGWTQDATDPSAFEVYNVDNLSDRIDGQNVAYISRGFRYGMYQQMVGPTPNLCTAIAMDFVTADNANTMFTYERDSTGAATPIPNYDAATALGAPGLTGMTVYAHIKASYFELQFDGFTSTQMDAAAQAGAQFLQVLQAKTP